MLGQVVYHLLAAAGATRAPWPVVVLVSCLPVATLGFGAALTHLLRNSDAQSCPAGGEITHPDYAPVIRNGVADSAPVPAAVPAVPGLHLNGSGLHPAEAQPFAGDLARGEVPTLRRIRAELHVGQPRAQEIQGPAVRTRTYPVIRDPRRGGDHMKRILRAFQCYFCGLGSHCNRGTCSCC